MIGEFLHRNKALAVLLGFVLISLLCLTMRVDPYVTGIKTSLWFLLSPEVVHSGEFFNRLDALKGRVFRLIYVEGENHVLREQNSRLAVGVLEREALEAENSRLRALLNLKTKHFADAIAAEVIARDPRDWFHAVVLNKGEKHGVTESAAVVAVEGERLALVGQIIEVHPTTSKVLLLTDAISAVSASVMERGDMGLVEGRNRRWVFMNYLSPTSEASPGEEILTLGLGGVFPPGIPIGRIESVSQTNDGYFRQAKVFPYAPLDSMLEVLVLKRTEEVRLKVVP